MSSEHINETFRSRLRRLRDEKKLTVKHVAEFLNIPTTTYREWENGRKIVGEPYIELSKLFNISVHELISGEKNTDQAAYKSIELIQSELSKLKQHLLSKE
jgi:transcriptional regulator with XRE-family HTH domain